jgi:hypothetical protein
MAVRISPIAIQPAARPIQALNHTSRLQGLKILVDRCMANVASQVIQLFKNIPRTQVSFLCPQQLQHHSTLFA